MWWRKKKEQHPPECNHHWQDFPWYFEAEYHQDVKRQRIRIYEPYVCIHCKKRKDVLLLDKETFCKSYDNACDWVADTIAPYERYMEPRGIIEDKIADMQLVDEDYLKYYRLLNNIKNPKESE